MDQEEIHNQCFSDDPKERMLALDKLKYFSSMSDKQQIWNDLVRLITDEYIYVSIRAADALGFAFSQVPDKQQAWNDLHKLTTDEDSYVRSRAVSALGSAFSQVPDKQSAWDDLHKLTTDEDSDVRSWAADALGSAFSQVPDKEQAWNDLHKLTVDEDSDVRSRAAHALGSTFSQFLDKQQAWNDLHRLTTDEDSDVRSRAADALGSAFSQVSDKQSAWNDLHRLTTDENLDVRDWGADALVSAFSQVPDKQSAWNDLHRLTTNEDGYVRSHAQYSLGKVSIFKASQAETDGNYKKELEQAIKFFEMVAYESSGGINPAKFCLPFYRSFYAILFKKQEGAKYEGDRYLAEAKDAVKGSKSKELLFEAVENLAKALEEVQNLGSLDLQGMKCELDSYRKYCEHATELMRDVEETAPFATKALEKGLPILDRNIKRLIEEIREKAKIACQLSKGTAIEEIACSVDRQVQKWEIGGNQEEVAKQVDDIAYRLKIKVADLPENEYFLNKIEVMMHEITLIKQLEILSSLIGLIPTVKVVREDIVMENINQIGQHIETKLNGLSQEMNKIRISLSPGIKQEIEISSGIEILGTGAKHIIKISLQEISYAELKEDLTKIQGRYINKLSKLPERLARKIKEYLLLNGREDIIEQLT